ncbi:MAG: HAD-IIIC family phosphatase, partial [Acidobacteriota bacterium]
GQDDLLIAAPTDGRHPAVAARADAVGFYAYPLLLRIDLDGVDGFGALLDRVRRVTLDAYRHRHVPFTQVLDALPEAGRPPLRLLFGLWDDPRADRLDLPGVVAESIAPAAADVDLELALTLRRDGAGGLRGQLRYARDLYDAATVDALLESYDARLGALVEPAADARDALALNALPIADALHQQAIRVRRAQTPVTLAVASTFTAEPIAPALAFWADRLGAPDAAIRFAPYNQVLQQLLTPSSPLRRNRRGANLLLVRLEDAWRFAGADAPDRGDAGEANSADPGTADAVVDAPPADAAERIAAYADDLLAALGAALDGDGGGNIQRPPWLLVLCPASDAARAACADVLDAQHSRLVDAADALPGLAVCRADDLLARYPVDGPVHDPYAERLGHIPYTEDAFIALASGIMRHLYGRLQPPLKVIVADCDGTLWDGVCAEDGADGVGLDAHRVDLQQRMIARQEGGVLLALASKNEPEDVFAVFERRAPDMPLTRDHLVGWRIDWRPKAGNVASLVDDLALGLDSVLFLDDNPVECAEMTAGAPAVAAVQIPATLSGEDPADLPAFLDHLWRLDPPSDGAAPTREDRDRTRMMRENASRAQAARGAASLGDFFAALALEIDVAAPAADDVPRLAQLTARTNQFNARKMPLDAATIEGWRGDEMAGDGGASPIVRAVRVRDRFGDYGLVGFLAARPDADDATTLRVDALLLSCRVLGRGVPHAMLAELGRVAQARSLTQIAIPTARAARNRPLYDFLESVVGPLDSDDSAPVARLTADAAAALRFDPAAVGSDAEDDAGDDGASAEALDDARPALWADGARLGEIARQLRTVDAIRAAIGAHRRASAPSGAADDDAVAPETALERELVALWSDLLGRGHPPSVTANFFDLGGDSLLGLQLLTRVRQTFGVELTLRDLLEEDLSIRALANLLEARQLDDADDDELDAMLAELDGLSEDEVRALLEEDA